MRMKRENLAKWMIYRFIMFFSFGDDGKLCQEKTSAVVNKKLDKMLEE